MFTNLEIHDTPRTINKIYKSLLLSNDNMSLISIIVPMYNEENRIEHFLSQLKNFIKSYSEDCKIILVNDGSTDNTLNVVNELSKNQTNIKIISYSKNRGKGAAVRKGIISSNGDFIIFIDADGSITPDQIYGMVEKLRKFDVVVGNRSLKDSKTQYTPLRNFFGFSFNFISKILFTTQINDHLCGFKGFKKDVAKELFKNLISKGWLFDVELFYKIRKAKFSLYELPIIWVYKPESKMKLYYPIFLFFELFKLRVKLFFQNHQD